MCNYHFDKQPIILNKLGVDRSVLNRVSRVVRKIQSKSILVLVVGGIQPETIDGFLTKVQPDKLNTREVTFDTVPGQEYSQANVETLRIEILILEHDAKQGFITLDEEKFRIKELKKRLK